MTKQLRSRYWILQVDRWITVEQSLYLPFRWVTHWISSLWAPQRQGIGSWLFLHPKEPQIIFSWSGLKLAFLCYRSSATRLFQIEIEAYLLWSSQKRIEECAYWIFSWVPSRLSLWNTKTWLLGLWKWQYLEF